LMGKILVEILFMEKQVSTFGCFGHLRAAAAMALMPFVLLMGLGLSGRALQAAEISDHEFNQLLESAKQREYVAVDIFVLRLTLAQMIDRAAGKAAMQPKVQALAAELGANVLPGSYWESGVGSIGVHVNEQGLQILKNSQHVIHFLPDYYQYKTRSKYNDYSGGLQAVEDRLLTTSSVDVELVLNVPVEYDFDSKSGEAVVNPSAQLYAQLAQVQQALFNKPFASDITNVTLLYDRAMMRATVNRNAFLGIVLSEEVRSIRPVGYVDPSKPAWSADVLVEAQKQGEVSVSMQLRQGRYFAIGAGTSEASTQAMQAANERAFSAIFAGSGLPLDQLQRDGYLDASTARYGYLYALLSVEVLNKLYAVKDPRIASVGLPGLVGWDPPSGLPDLVSTTTLSKPTEYCFPQTVIRGDYQKFIVDHHLLIDKTALDKAGDVFVVARFKDSPDVYWLMGYNNWFPYKRGTGRPMPYARFAELPPLVSTMAFPAPANIEANVEKGSIWVGYGLRQPSGAAVDSFEEMLHSERLQQVWEGSPSLPPNGQQEVLGTATLCLDIGAITQTTPRYKLTDELADFGVPATP
jgi:hypothetical protein